MGKKIVTMEEAIKSKKASIKKINKLLESYIHSGDDIIC